MNNPQQKLHSLLPHRDTMLLLDEIIAVTEKCAESLVNITQQSSFYIAEKGVPAWIGLEYMGQTAALIAGHQRQIGNLAEHTGFLLGSRQFVTSSPWFAAGATLQITCTESALVGDTLANFDCTIHAYQSADYSLLASATLSVFRQPSANTTLSI